jgi:hypothetical protein
MANQKECAHETCECQAQANSQYCSQACETSAGESSSECNCGHRGCAASQKSSASMHRAAR